MFTYEGLLLVDELLQTFNQTLLQKTNVLKNLVAKTKTSANIPQQFFILATHDDRATCFSQTLVENPNQNLNKLAKVKYLSKK